MKGWLAGFHPRNKLVKAREQYLRQHKAIPDAVRALLSAPVPMLDDDLLKADTLVFDIETTGLNPAQDTILSYGSVVIEQGMIGLSSSSHHYIQSPEAIKPETAVINHILPEMLAADGEALDDAMDMLLAEMVGRVLVVHSCKVEKAFLARYIEKRYQLPPLPLLWIDTLALDKALCLNKERQQCGDFRLGACRARHGLPPYQEHNALIDAVSTAELYLALLKRFSNKGRAKLKHLPLR
ncbi:3'-5' exonuclease [Thaumasiovibrio subtropicus]|uniref:3'-5' exonuclease n=1 Tax=Thaumasiovibrio subtropicus TaxID=1891207 RepID=UPI000B3502E9|nr:3'-5' exonuclease [Thaumasiovibrio subtropicus]